MEKKPRRIWVVLATNNYADCFCRYKQRLFHRALIYEESSVAVCSLAIIAVIIGYCNYLVLQTCFLQSRLPPNIEKKSKWNKSSVMLFQEIKWKKKKSQLSFGNKGDSSSCIPCRPPYCFYCLCPQNIVHTARRVSTDMSIKRRTQFEISFDLPFLLHSDPVIRYLTYKCYPYSPVKSAYF